MDELKKIIEEIEQYGDNPIYESKYYELYIKLIDTYWAHRKETKYGDKVFAIFFYHDFISDAVQSRMNCYYIEGKFDKFKDNTKLFPDWDGFIEHCKEDINSRRNNLRENFLNVKKIFELGYLPVFYGWYKGLYLKFIIDEEIGDYKIDLNYLDVPENTSKEIYNYIKENPLTFIDELRKKER